MPMMMMVVMMALFQNVENLLGEEGTETELESVQGKHRTKYCAHYETL